MICPSDRLSSIGWGWSEVFTRKGAIKLMSDCDGMGCGVVWEMRRSCTSVMAAGAALA